MEMDNAVPGPFPTPPLPNFNVGKTALVESQVVSTTLYQGDVYDTFFAYFTFVHNCSYMVPNQFDLLVLND